MTTLFSDLEPDDFQSHPKRSLEVLIGYEDEPGRDRAMALCERLAARVADDYDVQFSWWKFDRLRHPRLLDRAIEAAVGADLVLLSLHGNQALSPDARTWIEDWLTLKDGNNCALAVLQDRADQEAAGSNPALHYLNSMARRTHIEFFPHTCGE